MTVKKRSKILAEIHVRVCNLYSKMSKIQSYHSNAVRSFARISDDVFPVHEIDPSGVLFRGDFENCLPFLCLCG